LWRSSVTSPPVNHPHSAEAEIEQLAPLRKDPEAVEDGSQEDGPEKPEDLIGIRVRGLASISAAKCATHSAPRRASNHPATDGQRLSSVRRDLIEAETHQLFCTFLKFATNTPTEPGPPGIEKHPGTSSRFPKGFTFMDVGPQNVMLGRTQPGGPLKLWVVDAYLESAAAFPQPSGTAAGMGEWEAMAATSWNNHLKNDDKLKRGDGEKAWMLDHLIIPETLKGARKMCNVNEPAPSLERLLRFRKKHRHRRHRHDQTGLRPGEV
jgi:hypothetical protein